MELARFIGARRSAGEDVTAETFRRNVPRRLAPTIESFLDRFEDELGSEFCDAFEEWRRGVDRHRLPSGSSPASGSGRSTGRRRCWLGAGASWSRLHRERTGGWLPRRSVLLVGEHGVGKTAVVRAALERRPPSSLVLEATAAQVHAGAAYVGELETRVKEIVDT